MDLDEKKRRVVSSFISLEKDLMVMGKDQGLGLRTQEALKTLASCISQARCLLREVMDGIGRRDESGS